MPLYGLLKQMRKDMSKLITERPRRGGKYNRKGRAVDDREMPKVQGIRRPYTDRKEFSDNLQPLKRFLHSAVGRTWAAVHSEISAHIKLTSTVQRHVLEHLRQYVCESPHYRADGTIWGNRGHGSFYELHNGYFYVDSRGALRKYNRPNRYNREPKPYSDPFNQALEVFSTKKHRTVFFEGEFYRWTRDPKKASVSWTIVEPANATHARQDFKTCGSWRHELLAHWSRVPQLKKLMRKYADFWPTRNDPYATTLLKLYMEKMR